MLFFKRALCGLACALWMVGAAHAVDAGLVDAVRSTMRSPGELHTYSGGPEVYGGTPLVVNDNGYYWLKGGQVYAVNGVAMGMSPKVRKAPPSVGFALIDKAIESGKAVPLPANLGVDAWTFPEAINAVLKKIPPLNKGGKTLQLKKSTFYSWEAEEKGKTVGLVTLKETGGMVTSVHVSIIHPTGSESLTIPVAALMVFVPDLPKKKDDSPESQAMRQVLGNPMQERGKEFSATIGDRIYKGISEKPGTFDLTITPAAQ